MLKEYIITMRGLVVYYEGMTRGKNEEAKETGDVLVAKNKLFKLYP